MGPRTLGWGLCHQWMTTLPLGHSHQQYTTVHGTVDKPHPQEQYFQESPFLIGQGIPGKTGPRERGEDKQEVTGRSSSIDLIIIIIHDQHHWLLVLHTHLFFPFIDTWQMY